MIGGIVWVYVDRLSVPWTIIVLKGVSKVYIKSLSIMVGELVSVM